MPKKPKHPCAFDGCPRLTNTRFCEEHKQTENRRYNRYQRDKESAKRYGKEWKLISKAYRQANPLCELCKESGHFVPADCVHHKHKLADGGSHEWGNLQSLCNAHHSQIHAQQGDRWG